LTAEVVRDDVIKVEGSSVSESSDGKSVNVIFNARLAGLYTVYLKCNGTVVRGFPTVKRLK
jgi:hypothetical protein